VSDKLNKTAVEERNASKDSVRNVGSSAKEEKEKPHNSTFNNGSKDSKSNRAKAKKILQNFDFSKLFGKAQ
jgi:hypothetical protein